MSEQKAIGFKIQEQRRGNINNVTVWSVWTLWGPTRNTLGGETWMADFLDKEHAVWYRDALSASLEREATEC